MKVYHLFLLISTIKKYCRCGSTVKFKGNVMKKIDYTCDNDSILISMNLNGKVYNFEVEDYHTYYVSNSGVLVHNQCTNPYGKKGGPAHRAKIAEMKEKLKQKGYDTIGEEAKIDISNGYKSRKYADFAVSKNNKTIYVQVGKQTKSGMPVARERRAISDIESEGNTVWFFAYN